MNSHAQLGWVRYSSPNQMTCFHLRVQLPSWYKLIYVQTLRQAEPSLHTLPFDLSSSFGAAVAFKSMVKKVFIAKMLTDARSCVAVCVQASVADGSGDRRDSCILSWEAR